MEKTTIRYCFKFGNDKSEVFDVHLDPETLEIQEIYRTFYPIGPTSIFSNAPTAPWIPKSIPTAR